ncbi:hypothetical protein DSTSK_04000 [Desulforhabdus sp. TSK]|nr:hypothetical protein DSTSK_04000 [Desulforhabdus sp. TSK]
MESTWQEERRNSKDRRSKPTSPFSLASLRGRRKQARRAEDAAVHRYVDLYDGSSVSWTFLTLLLSLTDAFLTLEITARGGTEVNPFMDFFLDLGPVPFILSKYILTALGLLWLLIHKNFGIFTESLSVHSLLRIFPVLYGCLIVYELILMYWPAEVTPASGL